MLTRAQVAKDWNVSHQYVSVCVKRGCPLSSFQDARLWRSAHASRRGPTSQKQLARLVAEESDNDSAQPSEGRRNCAENGASTASVTDLEHSLVHAIELENEVYRLARQAMAEERESLIQVRVAIHNKAMEGRLKIETMIQELQEKRKTLVPFDAATAIYRKGLDVIMRKVRRLGQEKAAACNPQNPHHALAILENWIEEMIAEVRAQYSPCVRDQP
jgi:hypothetical protein